MQIMVIIGNVIGQRRCLRLGTRMGVQLQIVPRVICSQRIRDVTRHRPVMLCNSFKGFPCQVQSVPFGVVTLEICDNMKGLGIVVKAAVRLHQRVQRFFSGMAERRVAKVVRQSHGFGQFNVQIERSRDCTRHLCNLDRMRQTSAKIIALVFNKHLRFMLQTPKSACMNNPVAIPLKGRAKEALFFGIKPPPRI